eukprot:114434_1
MSSLEPNNKVVEEEKEAQIKNTIVVFGGNGFVGTRICELATKKVEWYKADALKIDTYSEYIKSVQPIAICTMMGVFNFWQQMQNEAEYIEKLVGNTNINACKLAKEIKSVKRFVYVGANVHNMKIDETSKYSLKTILMLGQYKAKMAVEKCVNDLFGNNGISFRPLGIAGYEEGNFFGYKYMKNKLPLYDYGWAKNMYHYFSPKTVTVQQLAQDCLDFIEMDENANVKNMKFHCANSLHDE